MSTDWRHESEWRTSRNRRHGAAATAPSYDYGSLSPGREAARPRRARSRRTGPRRAADRRFALFMIALLAWAGLGYASGLVRIVALRREIARVEEQLSEAQRRNKELEQTVAEMQTPEYIERAARDQLGLTRADEVRFVVGRQPDPADLDQRDVVRRPGTTDVYH